jgi:hypothetical protein
MRMDLMRRVIEEGTIVAKGKDRDIIAGATVI